MIRAAPRAPSRHPNRSLSTAASCGVSVALGLKRVRVVQVTFAEQVTFGAAGGRGGAQHEARKGLGNRAHAGGARGERGGAASCFPPTLCRTHLLSLSLPHISTHTYTPALSLFAHTHAHARTHARTHTHTHARTHAHTHTHPPTFLPPLTLYFYYFIFIILWCARARFRSRATCRSCGRWWIGCRQPLLLT